MISVESNSNLKHHPPSCAGGTVADFREQASLYLGVNNPSTIKRRSGLLFEDGVLLKAFFQIGLHTISWNPNALLTCSSLACSLQKMHLVLRLCALELQSLPHASVFRFGLLENLV